MTTYISNNVIVIQFLQTPSTSFIEYFTVVLRYKYILLFIVRFELI